MKVAGRIINNIGRRNVKTMKPHHLYLMALFQKYSCRSQKNHPINRWQDAISRPETAKSIFWKRFFNFFLTQYTILLPQNKKGWLGEKITQKGPEVQVVYPIKSWQRFSCAKMSSRKYLKWKSKIPICGQRFQAAENIHHCKASQTLQNSQFVAKGSKQQKIFTIAPLLPHNIVINFPGRSFHRLIELLLISTITKQQEQWELCH